MKRWIQIIALCLTFLDALCAVSPAEPGFKAMLSQKGLNLIGAFTKESFENFLKSQREMKFHGRDGGLEFSISAMKVTQFDSNFDVGLRFVEGKGIEMTLSRLTAVLESPYRVDTDYIFYNTGQLQMDITQFQLKTVLSPRLVPGRGGSGLRLNVRSCSADSAALNVKFKGGLINRLFNLFRTRISRRIQSSIESTLCSYIRRTVAPQLSDALGTVALDYALFDPFRLNVSLVEPKPAVTVDSLVTSHDGTIFPVGRGVQLVRRSRGLRVTHVESKSVEAADNDVSSGAVSAGIGDISGSVGSPTKDPIEGSIQRTKRLEIVPLNDAVVSDTPILSIVEYPVPRPAFPPIPTVESPNSVHINDTESRKRDTSDQPKMVSLFFSPWVLDSLLYYIAALKTLDVAFTRETLPDEFKPYLNTECDFLCAGTVFPNVADKYPSSALDILMEISRPPRARITQHGGITVEAIMNFTGYVRPIRLPPNADVNDHRVYLFTGLADANVSLSLSFVEVEHDKSTVEIENAERNSSRGDTDASVAESERTTTARAVVTRLGTSSSTTNRAPMTSSPKVSWEVETSSSASSSKIPVTTSDDSESSGGGRKLATKYEKPGHAFDDPRGVPKLAPERKRYSIEADVEFQDVDLHSVVSTVNGFDPDALKFVLNYATSAFIEPHFGQLLSGGGVDIAPVGPFSVADGAIRTHDGLLEISTDFVYEPLEV